jgi:hypothetical protein
VTAPVSFVTDQIAPTIQSVFSNESSTVHKAGESVKIKVGVSEEVTVTGAPTLTLSTGATAVYSAAESTATTLVFTYLVAATGASENAALLRRFRCHQWTIVDSVGNALVTTLPVVAAAGHSVNTDYYRYHNTDDSAWCRPSISYNSSYKPTWVNGSDVYLVAHTLRFCTSSNCTSGCTSVKCGGGVVPAETA